MTDSQQKDEASQKEEGFVTHLIELRDRLMRAAASVIICFLALVYWAPDIYSLLADPLVSALPAGTSMIATDVTALVHGVDAERAAAEAADVLFGGDPTRASRAALDAVAREVPSTTVSRAQLSDLVAVLTTTQLAQSNSDARRTLGQKGFRANGQTIADDTDLSTVSLLAGEYLLLRRGKTQHHLVRVEG